MEKMQDLHQQEASLKTSDIVPMAPTELKPASDSNEKGVLKSNPVSQTSTFHNGAGGGERPLREAQDGQGKWAAVGKLATVVAIIGGLVTLWTTLYPRGPLIVAQCQNTDVSAIGKFLEREASLQRQKNLETMPTEKAANPKKRSNVGIDSSEAVSPNSSSRTVVFYPYDRGIGSFAESYLMTCKISNKGTEPAEDVVLDLPGSPGRALIDERQLEKANLSKSIKLGVVRPGPEVVVAFTHSDFSLSQSFSPAKTNNMHLSFKGGVGELQSGRMAFGLLGRIAWSVENFSKEAWVVLLLLFGLLGYFLLRVILANGTNNMNSKGS